MEPTIDKFEERQITFLSPPDLLKKALETTGLKVTPKPWSSLTSLPSDLLGNWEVDEDITSVLRQQNFKGEIKGDRVALAVIAQMDGSRSGVKLLSSAAGTNVPCAQLFKACAHLHPELPDVVHAVARTSDGALFLLWDELGHSGLRTVDDLFLDLVKEVNGDLEFLKALVRSDRNPFDPVPFRISTAVYEAKTLYVPFEDQAPLFARWMAQGHGFIERMGKF